MEPTPPETPPETTETQPAEEAAAAPAPTEAAVPETPAAPAAAPEQSAGAAAAETVDAREAGEYACPRCGQRYDQTAVTCSGSDVGPHEPTAVVPVAELEAAAAEAAKEGEQA